MKSLLKMKEVQKYKLETSWLIETEASKIELDNPLATKNVIRNKRMLRQFPERIYINREMTKK